MAELEKLTRKHGIRISAPFPCSVEQVALAVGEKVGYSSVKTAARMNGAVVIFLDRVEKVNSVVETGVTVLDRFVLVQPLSQPSTRIVLSNVPPFASDDQLIKELSRYGRVVSSVKKFFSGIKSPLMKHVMSYRRHVFMILNDRREDLNINFRVRVDDYDYMIFASSAGMKCFSCGEEGHSVKSCPQRCESAPAGPAESPGAAAAAAAAPDSGRRVSAWGVPPPVTPRPGLPGDAAVEVRPERPVAAPRALLRKRTAVTDLESTGHGTSPLPGQRHQRHCPSIEENKDWGEGHPHGVHGHFPLEDTCPQEDPGDIHVEACVRWGRPSLDLES